MGDYYGCAFRVLAVSVNSQHMVKSLTLNPYMSLFNLKLCTHIWSTNINFRQPLTSDFDFLVRLGLVYLVAPLTLQRGGMICVES